MRSQLIATSIILSRDGSWDYLVERLNNHELYPFLYMEEDDFHNYWDIATTIADDYIVVDKDNIIQFEIKKGTLWTI